MDTEAKAKAHGEGILLHLRLKKLFVSDSFDRNRASGDNSDSS